MTRTLAIAAVLAALPVTAALAGEKCDGPAPQRQSFEAFMQVMGDYEWTIKKMRVTDGCYDLRVRDSSGNTLNVMIDPATLQVVDGQVVRFADGTSGSL